MLNGFGDAVGLAGENKRNKWMYEINYAPSVTHWYAFTNKTENRLNGTVCGVRNESSAETHNSILYINPGILY